MLLNRTLRKPYDRWNNKNGNSLAVRRDERKEHAGLKTTGRGKKKTIGGDSLVLPQSSLDFFSRLPQYNFARPDKLIVLNRLDC